MNSTAQPAPNTSIKSMTCKNFDEGARVYHKEYGYGVVRISTNGQKYPRFEGSTGTPYTRVWAA